MSIFSRITSLVTTGFSTDRYYISMNHALKRLDEEYTMLHYPYFRKENDSFLDAQKNLTDYCISLLNSIKGKKVLEVGCGNGVQARYILKKYSPALMKGIDLNPANIEIAKSETSGLDIKNISFQVDDAQKLSSIENKSMDCIISIESAFHYPDKASFLKEIFRILKPGGSFLIADILTVPGKNKVFKKFWKKKMHLYHWSRHTYENELFIARLKIKDLSDITNKVIKGFEYYRQWLRGMKKKNFFDDFFIKLFLTINVELNMYLLRSRRQYCVIVGEKPLKS